MLKIGWLLVPGEMGGEHRMFRAPEESLGWHGLRYQSVWHLHLIDQSEVRGLWCPLQPSLAQGTVPTQGMAWDIGAGMKSLVH